MYFLIQFCKLFLDTRYSARDEIHYNVKLGFSLAKAFPSGGEKAVLNAYNILVMEFLHNLKLTILNGLVLDNLFYSNDFPC